MVTINLSLRSKEKSDIIRDLLKDPKLCSKPEVNSKNYENNSVSQTTQKPLPYIVNRIDNYKVSVLDV